jgi:hypothetical protein
VVNEMKIKYLVVLLIIIIFITQTVGAEFLSNVFDKGTEEEVVGSDTDVEPIPPEPNPRPPIMDPQTLEDCDKYTDIDMKNNCYLKMADKTGDSDICLEVTVPYRRDKCYVLAAARSKDSNICENVEEDDKKDFCYEYIVKQV